MVISNYIKSQCCYYSIGLLKLLKMQLEFLYGPHYRVNNISESEVSFSDRNIALRINKKLFSTNRTQTMMNNVHATIDHQRSKIIS